jgi:hypothetical protein
MPSRLSIFSSRLFNSALIWAVLAVILVEWRAQRTLPGQYPSHEVDRMLYDLDHGRISEHDTVFLGDSVGLQISEAILRLKKDAFALLASNAAIETPGQYYVFQRYLEHHAAPKRVVLMMGNPLEGQLRGDFTENYLQRGFLRWREIAEIAQARRSLSFSLVMVAYKLFPTFRFRQALQKQVPLLERPNPFSGRFTMTSPSGKHKSTAKHGLLDVIAVWLKNHRRGPQIAEIYFLRLASLFEERGIEWLYLPLPVSESSAAWFAPDGFYGQQVRRIQEWSAAFPSMRMSAEFRTYPDEWFSDGTHFRKINLPPVVEDYGRILASFGYP